MAKISACVISYNEEHKIEDCLKSLQAVADEIILVDSNSTDATRGIAAAYADEIYIQDFLGHVQQKNHAVAKASHDWILSLDCDERLSPELQESILSQKAALGQGPNAYQMARKTFYIYRWLEHCWYPDFKVRLFDRRHGEWGGTNPHDKVIVKEGSVETLNGDILHYSFDSVSDHLKTLDNFTEIAAHELIEQGKNPGPLTPLTHASWTFFKLYILKRAFLDGFAGLTASVLSFMHVYVKYAKAITYRKQRSKT